MSPLTPDAVPALVKTGASTRRADGAVAPRFKVGDRVVARNMNPIGHTRLPRYVRSKHGVIHHNHGVFVFPDTSAHGGGDTPQHRPIRKPRPVGRGGGPAGEPLHRSLGGLSRARLT
jgi:Nitrile hydratase beta subunit, C-terminal